MSGAEEKPSPRSGAVVAVIAAALVGGFILLAGLGILGSRYWSKKVKANPPPPPALTVEVSLDKTGLARYRIKDKLDALGERELGRQIAELKKQRGELALRFDELFHEYGIIQKHLDAAKAAGPEIYLPALGIFGYRDGSSRWKAVRVFITGPVDGGNRYLLDDQPVEGEEALKAALGKALADWRAGKDVPGRYTLRVELKVEVKPGITATEEQIALARETIKTAGVDKPEAKQ